MKKSSKIIVIVIIVMIGVLLDLVFIGPPWSTYFHKDYKQTQLTVIQQFENCLYKQGYWSPYNQTTLPSGHEQSISDYCSSQYCPNRISYLQANYNADNECLGIAG